MNKSLRTWIEIDTKALAHNYHFFRKRISSKTKLLAVTKSNAYGHSLVDYAKLMSRLGVDYLGVDSIVEALKLRQNKITKPILVLGYTLPVFYNQAIKQKIILSISSLEQLNHLEKFTKTKKGLLKIHLKIDTGMHRQGFLLADLPEALTRLTKLKTKIKIEGIYSHLAAPAEAKYKSATKKQIANFETAIRLTSEAGFSKLIRHLSATGGTLYWPKTHFDLVRIGIGLYGYLPGGNLQTKKLPNLKPVLTWKTIISEIKNVPKGERIGYSFTAKLKRNSRLAILPIGYWHGYPRLLSDQAEVLIQGKRAKLIGRVSMDMLIIDVTDIKNCQVGDEVILLGPKLKATELADKIKTTHYEILTRINPLIKKIMCNDRLKINYFS